MAKKSKKVSLVCIPCGAEVEVSGEGMYRNYCCGQLMLPKKRKARQKKGK